MLEWIIGALVVGALGGGNKPSTPSYRSSSSSYVPQRTSKQLDDEYRNSTEDWRSAWEKEIDRQRWIPASTARRILAKHPAPAPPLPSFGHLYNTRKVITEADLKTEFDKHNQQHLAFQKDRLKSFFDTIEKNPLTEEQINACICMDDNVQIVAAAGSGKTSTMVAKAGYALHEGLASGDQILLLAFNADAANELAERCTERLKNIKGADKLTAKTFHSFGMHVVGKATGEKPRLAPWLNHDGGDIKMMSTIIDETCKKDPNFALDLNLFRTVYGRDVGRWSVPDQPEAYANKKYGFRTANGEIVKSKEERLIANWLFYHHVKYQYERPYEHKVADEHHSQYHPDFYYPDIKLYHEHFALNSDGDAPQHFDRDYKDGVIWKRRLHQRMGTKLFETTSHQVANSTALTKLRKTLIEHGNELKFDPNRPAPGAQPVSLKEIARNLRIFQTHVKSNSLNQAQLHAALKAQTKDGYAERFERFLSIYERVADEWEKKLAEGDYIDFEDMLIHAADHIERGRYASPFTIVLSDEFQDSSRARIRLLKALTNNKGNPAHLCVVGDDWQGINRFAGADIHVMTEFEQIFTDATRLTLNTTFRCPQKICDVSSGFIQANPFQIRKNVATASLYKHKDFLLAYGFNDHTKANAHLAEQLKQMYWFARDNKVKPEGEGKITVLLLGRYNDDKPRPLGRWQEQYGDLIEIDFKTVHSTKGLEADYVMVLNMVEGIRGFPSQIEDDPVLQIPMPAPDPFPMAEERRLFYVALTRARRQVRIYTTNTKPSRFLVELADKGDVKIEAMDGDPPEPCPRCKNGVLTIRNGTYGKFRSCSTWPRCNFKVNIPMENDGLK